MWGSNSGNSFARLLKKLAGTGAGEGAELVANTVQIVADAATAATIAPTANRKLFISSASGGFFTAKLSGGPFVSDGASGACGSIIAFGDGSAAWVADSPTLRSFGVVGDGSDESASVASAIASTVKRIIIDVEVSCKAVKFTADKELEFKDGGKIRSLATVEVEAVRIFCPVIAQETQHIFKWTAVNTTALAGTDVPFLFGKNDGEANNAPKTIPVTWFGNELDVGDVSCARAFTVAAIACSYGVYGGSYTTALFGPNTIKFPKGLYSMLPDGGQKAMMIAGQRLLGDGSGSHALSALYCAPVGASTASAVTVVSHFNDVTKGRQIFVENLGHRYVTNQDFATSETELDFAWYDLRGGVAFYDNKFDNSWFLGTPQKGSVLRWGNKYNAAGAKIDTASDADGLEVTNTFTDTFIDVVSMIVKVVDKGFGKIDFNNGHIYRTDLGLSRNYSTHSTGKLVINVNNTPWTYPTRTDTRVEVAAAATTARHELINTEWNFNGGRIEDGVENFTYSLGTLLKDNSAFRIDGARLIGDHRLLHPVMDLTGYTDNLAQIRNSELEGTWTTIGAAGKNLVVMAKNPGAGVNDSSVQIFEGNIFRGAQGDLVHLTSNGNSLTYAHLDLLIHRNNTTHTFTTPIGVVVADITKYFFTNNVDSSTANG